MCAMAREDDDWFRSIINRLGISRAPVVKIEIPWFILRHGQQAVPEGSVPRAPDGEVCTNGPIRSVVVLLVIPKLDAFIQGASYQAGGFGTIPVETIDLGGMRNDRLERLSRLPVIPDVEPSVMRRCENVRILTVVLDLRGTSKPVAKRQDRLSRASKIPGVDVAIY